MKRKIISILLAVILTMTSYMPYCQNKVVQAESSQVTNLFIGVNFQAVFILDSTYTGGYHARIQLKNTGSKTIEDWNVEFKFDSDILNLWNGVLSKKEDDIYQVKNAGWNQDIEPGGTVEFGFSGSSSKEPSAPEKYWLMGCGQMADSTEYDITYELKQKWETGYIVSVSIANLTDFTMEDWMLRFVSSKEIQSMWKAEMEEQKDGTYQVKNVDDSQNISACGTVSFEYMVQTTDGDYSEPSQFVLYYQREIENEPSSSVSIEPTKTQEVTISEQPSDVPEESIIPVTQNPGSKEVPVSETPVVTEPLETEDMEEEADMTDSDADGLPDVLEKLIGTDEFRVDTDEDSLTDCQEVYMTGTEPLLADSDGNGVMDADEDSDQDGLTNIVEIRLGTSALCTDSDEDSLNDGEEVNQYGSDPLNEDTDTDSITDGDEILLGLNPLLTDSDGNGIPDDEERIEQTFEASIEEEEKPEVTKVEVSFDGTGNIQNSTEIESVYNMDAYSSELAGLVGAPVEITTGSEFDHAEITFHYDEEKLGDTSEDDLGIVWYNEENGDYVQMKSTADPDQNTITCQTTHFSTYMLVNTGVWKQAMDKVVDYNLIKNFDTAFVCESSYDTEDYLNGMATAARALAYNTQYGDNVCEIEYGDTACVEYDFGKEDVLRFETASMNDEFTLDLQYGSGETDYGYQAGKGLKLALDKLGSMGKRNEKIIFLICSGIQVDDVSSEVELAKENGIRIFTAYFQNGDAVGKLKDIAAQTGGACLDLTSYNLDDYEELRQVVNLVYDNFPDICERKGNTLADKDGDGIPDIFETIGIKATNGKIFFCDPDKTDSDEDGLTDAEEINLKTEEVTGDVTAYLCSNPLLADSDSDGLTDYEDPRPNSKVNNGATLKITSGRLTNIQKWLAALGYLDMGENPYGVNYGALTRTAVNIYQLNHGFLLKTYMDVNTYATIANDYYVQTKQGESTYRNECGKLCGKKYYSNIRIVEPRLTTYYQKLKVKIAKKTNVSFKSENSPVLELYLYDYTELVNRMLSINAVVAKEMRKLEYLDKCKTFISYVDNDGPWDIKRRYQWRVQLGNVLRCSNIFPFVFNNEVVTPEMLGNITYGYWGKYAGFTLVELLAGGNVAALRANHSLDSSDDMLEVKKGVALYYKMK